MYDKLEGNLYIYLKYQMENIANHVSYWDTYQKTY